MLRVALVTGDAQACLLVAPVGSDTACVYVYGIRWHVEKGGGTPYYGVCVCLRVWHGHTLRYLTSVLYTWSTLWRPKHAQPRRCRKYATHARVAEGGGQATSNALQQATHCLPDTLASTAKAGCRQHFCRRGVWSFLSANPTSRSETCGPRPTHSSTPVKNTLPFPETKSKPV